jgi:hypothetical protein
VFVSDEQKTNTIEVNGKINDTDVKYRLKENDVKAIDIIPKKYYNNILKCAYNRKEKYIPKNKIRKNPKKMYL